MASDAGVVAAPETCPSVRKIISSGRVGATATQESGQTRADRPGQEDPPMAENVADTAQYGKCYGERQERRGEDPRHGVQGRAELMLQLRQGQAEDGDRERRGDHAAKGGRQNVRGLGETSRDGCQGGLPDLVCLVGGSGTTDGPGLPGQTLRVRDGAWHTRKIPAVRPGRSPPGMRNQRDPPRGVAAANTTPQTRTPPRHRTNLCP